MTKNNKAPDGATPGKPSRRKLASRRARKLKSPSARRKQVEALRTPTQKAKLKKRYHKRVTVKV